MPVTFREAAEIDSNVRRIRAVLDSGIFLPQSSRSPLVLSALTEVMIRLHDLLQKASRHGVRVDFKDDVLAGAAVSDVTDLVAFVRNAVCHIPSGNHNHEEVNATVSFCAAIGKGVLANLGGVKLENPYEDDTAFFFGPQRVLLRRHLVRSFEEVVPRLEPLLPPPFQPRA
jgi:hypothetical protein